MNAILRLGHWIGALQGRKAFFLALAAGAVSATAFAPLNFFPALLLGFAVLALLVEAATARPRPIRSAASIGWAFSFGQFVVGLHWIGYAFMVDPTAHLWQMPFALLGLCAGLALFGAAAAGFAARLPLRGAPRLVMLAVVYAAAEWLRGHVLTGLPWNLPAYGWGASLAVLQAASLVGAYGLSFLTVLFGVSLAALTRRQIALPVLMALVFLGLWSFGALRLAAPLAEVPGVQLRLVQPNIPQREKHRREFVQRNWDRLLGLSVTRPAGRSPNVIIWPEAATDFPVARAPEALKAIALLTGPARTVILGSERVEAAPGGLAFYNSLYIFGPGGKTLSVYDKFHLVPFGEYVPFGGLLSRFGVTKLTAGQLGFSEGDGPHRYIVPGTPLMTPLICYEVIFPGAVTAGRPGWFVNVTDDSWFGPWAGPRQHFLTARVRAIEEGVPIARAANTGISAMIDPLGRVQASLGLGKMGVVDAMLPQAATPTPYSRFGDLGFLALMLLGAGLAVFATARRR